jgi:hypothetical protein
MYLSFLKHTDRFWGTPYLLLNDKEGSFPLGKSGRSVKLTTDLYVGLKSRKGWSYISTPMYAFIPSLEIRLP